MMECAEDDLEFTAGRSAWRVPRGSHAPEIALAVFAAHDLPTAWNRA
jgi:hypothetical protein